jgi:Lar family restriction alleviation protein
MTEQKHAMEQALEACPFCAQEPMDVPLESMFHTFHIICPHCEADGPERMTRTDAIAAWNRRAALSSLPDVQTGLPGGFQLLPVEATDSMMDADWDVTMSEAHSNGGVAAAAWRAMVEAAPQVTYGNGHSGAGWYMHDTEYPEEGAVFLSAASAPKEPGRTDGVALGDGGKR